VDETHTEETHTEENNGGGGGVYVPAPEPDHSNEGLAGNGWAPAPMSEWEWDRRFEWMEKNLVKPADRSEAAQNDLVLPMLTEFFGIHGRDTLPPRCFHIERILWMKKVIYDPKHCHYDDASKQETRWDDLSEADRIHFTLKHRQMVVIEHFVMKIASREIRADDQKRWTDIIEKCFPNDESERKRLLDGFHQTMRDTYPQTRRMSGGVASRLKGLIN